MSQVYTRQKNSKAFPNYPVANGTKIVPKNHWVIVDLVSFQIEKACKSHLFHSTKDVI
jgi:hypothetical protein